MIIPQKASDIKDGKPSELQDLPVFNGKYSTTCYSEATLRSLEDMFTRRGIHAPQHYRDLPAVFLHRPYRRMPESGWAMGYLFSLAHDDERERAELGQRHEVVSAGRTSGDV